MITKLIHNLVSLAELAAMDADELEQYGERGPDYRHVLSCSVLKLIQVSENWHMDVEYRCEFGGLHPVPLQFYCRNNENPDTDWYLSSAGRGGAA
ncbi:conjugation system SOS inhibitor PsiB family protein [Photorhabdus sp. RM71S]|uniref:conjugation system SOS inhibitor PsiB family protein n=1 Tax=Photorhabdus sp. RM71S TaxID=3342824 RepID=UPI0036DF88F1